MISANSVLVELETLTYNEVVSMNKDEKTALSCKKALVDCLYLNFKNRLMYIPSPKNQHVDEIYQSIYKEFTGNNHQELAIRFKRSTQNIYSIVKREKINNVRKLQTDIFSDHIKEEDKRSILIFILEEHLPNEFVHCGIEELQAKELSNKISLRICSKFPGVSIYISEAIRNKRKSNNQTSIF